MKAQPPMRPVELQILIALLGRPLHGYALVKSVREESHGAIELEPGNLYRRLHRLLSAGLARECGADEVPAADADSREGRRYYAITASGRQALAAELRRSQAQLHVARGYGLHELEGGAE